MKKQIPEEVAIINLCGSFEPFLLKTTGEVEYDISSIQLIRNTKQVHMIENGLKFSRSRSQGSEEEYLLKSLLKRALGRREMQAPKKIETPIPPLLQRGLLIKVSKIILRSLPIRS